MLLLSDFSLSFGATGILITGYELYKDHIRSAGIWLLGSIALLSFCVFSM
jgi:hypothetical protein